MKYDPNGVEDKWEKLVAFMDQARAKIAQEARMPPSFVVLRCGAEGALCIGKLEAAERFAREALGEAPSDPDSLSLLAKIQLRGGRRLRRRFTRVG